MNTTNRSRGRSAVGRFLRKLASDLMRGRQSALAVERMRHTSSKRGLDQSALAADSQNLLRDRAFQTAYTHLYEQGINRLMRLDSSSERDQIVQIQVELRALESVARQLNSYVVTAEFNSARKKQESK